MNTKLKLDTIERNLLKRLVFRQPTGTWFEPWVRKDLLAEYTETKGDAALIEMFREVRLSSLEDEEIDAVKHILGRLKA